MQIELRRKSRTHAAYRATLWAVVTLGLATLYLQNSPWEIEAEVEESEGIEIARESQADIIVVIDYNAIRRSGPDFEQRDWSAAWINLVEQEMGPVTVATPQSLSNKVLSDARIVILTSSVSGQINASLMSRLRDHVESGKLIVMERPQGVLRDEWAADGRAGARRAQHITFALDLAEPYATELRQMPLSTEFIGSTRAATQSTTLLSIDGAPVVYVRDVGEGHVITVDFDLGEQLVAMQQGRPNGKMKVRAKNPGESGDLPPKTHDLVMDERLIGAPAPYADMLERFIMHGAILRYMPAPTLWYYPDGAYGVVVAIHEDSSLGNSGGWMLDHETSQKALSSLLTSVDSGLTASGAATIHRKGGDIGLLWRMEGTPSEQFERLGVSSFKPVARPITIKQQISGLKETLPINYVRTVRSMDGWWSERWSAPFSQLAKQGLRLDLSYEVPQTAGYAWGTGLPFLVMSDEGIPYGVREMPVVYPDRVVEGADFLTMLEASQHGHHMAMAVSLSPSSFASYPDLERFNHWLDLFTHIKERGHIMTSAYNLDTYLRSRRASSLRSRVVRDARLPSDSNSLPTLQEEALQKLKDKKSGKTSKPVTQKRTSRRAQLMRVTVEAKARGMSLMVPGTMEDHSFHSARRRSNRGGKDNASSRIETSEIVLMGFPQVRIPLDRGFNTIDIYYTPQNP